MDPKQKSVGPDGLQNTLGALLYADRSVPFVAETDWVRVVRAIAGGDQRALQALYERSHRLVFTLAMRLSGNREIAEEITVDVFQEVWSRSPKYEPENGPVVGWIMNIARSRAIDRLRYEQRAKRRAPAPDVAGDAGLVAPQPGDALDAERRHGSLLDGLKVLTADERAVIETAFFSELSYSETATRLALPIGTVKTRIRAALAKLRGALVGEGEVS